MIECVGISKQFKVARRNAGFGEAVRALFRRKYTIVQALSDVTFTIGDGEMVGYIGPIIGASIGPDAVAIFGFGKPVTFNQGE